MPILADSFNGVGFDCSGGVTPGSGTGATGGTTQSTNMICSFQNRNGDTWRVTIAITYRSQRQANQRAASQPDEPNYAGGQRPIAWADAASPSLCPGARVNLWPIGVAALVPCLELRRRHSAPCLCLRRRRRLARPEVVERDDAQPPQQRCRSEVDAAAHGGRIGKVDEVEQQQAAADE